jgi:CRP-like cAMP-binding protein
MQNAGELKRTADELLFAEKFEGALASYVDLLEQEPLHLDARLRIADTLLALGEVQRAAIVYTRLAQYAAHAGHPLRALVALKILATLEPELAGLLQAVAELYGAGSPKLGQGTRRSLPTDDAKLEPREPTVRDRAELIAHAERLASDYAHKDAFYPERLMPIPLLSGLPAPALGTVVTLAGLVRARPGTVIMEQGTEGRSVFLLARGSVRASRVNADGAHLTLATLHEGALFGEQAVFARTPRTATVTALTDCDLLELSVDVLAQPGLETFTGTLQAFARERMLGHVLAHAPLFSPLDSRQRRDLLQRFVELEVPAGTEIVRQGEPGKGAYVVARGEVSVQRSEGGQTVELARLGASELFGEMSLLTGEGANASVTATAPSALLLLGRDYFERLLESLPEVREQVIALSQNRRSQIRASFVPGGDGDEVEIEVLL